MVDNLEGTEMKQKLNDKKWWWVVWITQKIMVGGGDWMAILYLATYAEAHRKITFIVLPTEKFKFWNEKVERSNISLITEKWLFFGKFVY